MTENKITIHLQKKKTLVEFLNKFEKPDQILAMRVNGLSKTLNTILHRKCKIELIPIYKNSVAGEAMLRRSFIFVMSKALDDLVGAREWFVEHHLETGYFCNFADLKTPEDGFVEKLTKKMKELIEEEIPIVKRKMYYNDAVNFFTKEKLKYTLSLLKSMNCHEVDVDECKGYCNLNHRALIHNTKVLKNTKFEIERIQHGWVIHFSFSKWKEYYQPTEIGEERIVKIYKQRNDFNASAKCECVGDINRFIISKKIENFVCLNNTFQDLIINYLVSDIKKRKSRVVLIAGPSAAGKTTFALKLGRFLKCRGIKSSCLSVDDYYKPRVECPKDPHTGEYDFEKLEALRIDRLNDDLNKLFEGKEIPIPRFDFITGKPIENFTKLRLPEKNVLIIEGIHCLNDKLTPKVNNDLKYKIFIAPLTPINLDDRNFISNKTIRLLRRIIRDRIHRGYNVEQTLNNWPSVQRGEHMYIFPYIKDSHFIFNSALDYEVGVLKPYVEPLLKTVKPSSKHFNLAYELLSFLDKFHEVPYKYVPRDSILQEFVKGHWRN